MRMRRWKWRQAWPTSQSHPPVDTSGRVRAPPLLRHLPSGRQRSLIVGPVDLSHVAFKEEAALTIRYPEDDPMSRRRGANHQRRLWSDPSWRPVNQLVTLLSFAVFILDVEVFTL